MGEGNTFLLSISEVSYIKTSGVAYLLSLRLVVQV